MITTQVHGQRRTRNGTQLTISSKNGYRMKNTCNNDFLTYNIVAVGNTAATACCKFKIDFLRKSLDTRKRRFCVERIKATAAFIKVAVYL